MIFNFLKYRFGIFILFLFVLTALHPQNSFGQIENHMILKKNGLTNRMHFLTGDNVTFIRQGSTIEEGGTIQGISTDGIIIAGQEYPIKNIGTLVYHRKSFNFRAGGATVMMAGPLYLLVGAVNALIQASRPIWSIGNLAIAGTLSATGLGLKSLQVRRFKLGKKYQLRIVQSDPELTK